MKTPRELRRVYKVYRHIRYFPNEPLRTPTLEAVNAIVTPARVVVGNSHLTHAQFERLYRPTPELAWTAMLEYERERLAKLLRDAADTEETIAMAERALAATIAPATPSNEVEATT